MDDWFGLKPIIDKQLWSVEWGSTPRWRAWLIGAARVLYVLVRDLVAGDLNLRAMSLVYTTLLSMVPVLAVAFALLKAFGAHEAGEEMLSGLLAPLGEGASEITSRIIQFVDRIKVGVLGVVGVGLLFFTIISLMQKIERAFNSIWYISEGRSFARRFSDYMTVVLIGPLLIFGSTAMTAMVMNQSIVQWLSTTPVIGFFVVLGGKLVPYLLAVGAFTMLYLFMPNTRVNIRSAFIGALVAALLWKGMGWLFATVVAGSAKYAAIYSVFSTLILFMIFLYLGWMVLLIGSSIAFYDQNPEYLRIRRDQFRMSNQLSERLALHIAYRIADRYQRGEPPWTAGALAQELNVPTLAIERIMVELEIKGFMSRNAAEPAGYLPARPIDEIPVIEVLQATRQRGEKDQISSDVLPDEPSVDHTVEMIDRAITQSIQGVTLKDLALAGPLKDLALAEAPSTVETLPVSEDQEPKRAQGQPGE